MPGREQVQTPPHEYYVDLVRRSPKLPDDKITPFEKEHGHLQFGNNFYCLFLARLRAERDPEIGDHGIQIYLGAAQRQYGDQWQRFLSHNQELVKKIDHALDGLEPYDELLRHYRDLLREAVKTGDYALADEYETLGIESVGILAWRKLNPLLEKAAKQMDKDGIKSKEFFA